MKRSYQGKVKFNKMSEFGYDLQAFLNNKARILCQPSLNTIKDIEYSLCKEEFKEFENFILGSECLTKDIVRNIDCAKIFKSNESVYICRDCATDSTCVFCKECFVKSEHIKHNYQMSFSNGSGFCDCGDVEAWKAFPRCTLHGGSNLTDNYDSLEIVLNDISKLSEDTKIRFLSLIKQIFKNFKYFIMRPLCKGSAKTRKIELNRELSIIKPENVKFSEYGLVLYNNEIHNFDEIISLFNRCLSCSNDEAMDFANIINRDGRCVALINNDISDLEIKQKQISFISKIETGVEFLCRIHHSTVLSIQTLLLHILRWLFEFVNEQKTLRLLLCHYLFDDVRIPNGYIFKRSTFIQDIFESHNQTWKMARSMASNFIMTTVMKETYFKRLFSIEFVKNYKMNIEHYSTDDHNVEDSLTSLSCQIFTVPSLAKYLLDNNNVLRTVIEVSYEELMKHSKPLILDDESHPNLFYFNKTENIFHNKLDSFEMHLESLNDVDYLLTSLVTSFLGNDGDEMTSTTKSLYQWTALSISNFMDFFCIFSEILSLIQDSNVIERMIDYHIEHDPPWRTGLLLMHDLVSVISLTSTIITSNDICWDQSFTIFREIFRNRIITFESKKIVLFEYDRYRANVIDNSWPEKYVSVIKPLHRFMSSLLQSSNIKELTEMEVDCLFDQALQMMVFTSNQTGNMWIRNGNVPYILIQQMKSLVLAPEMFYRDIQLIQQMALCMTPEQFILKCVHKYALKEYLMSESDTLQENESLLQRVEDFLQLLITTLFFRHRVGVGNRVIEEMCFENMIFHILCVKPLTHSKIMKKLPHILQKYPKNKIMDIIDKVSNQTKQSQKIIFNVKTSLIRTTFDRFSIYYSLQDRNEAEVNVQNILRNEEVISPAIAPEPLDLTDDFNGLYCYLSDPCFIQILDKILIFVNEKRCGEGWTDTILDMVLYLIGACLMDDLKVLKKSKQYQRLMFMDTTLVPSFNIKIIETLENLRDKVKSNQQLELIKWTIKTWYDVKRKVIYINTNEEIGMEIESVNIGQQNKLSKVDASKRRKEKLMNRMKSMQKKFLNDNDNISQTLTKEDTSSCCQDVNLTCILCQENSYRDCHRPFVALAGAWRSTVLARRPFINTISDTEILISQAVNAPEEDVSFGISPEVVSQDSNMARSIDGIVVRSILPMLDHSEETFITTCGHVMHNDCKVKYMSDLNNRKQNMERTNDILYPRIFNRCPLCKCVYNIDIPIVKDENDVVHEEKIEIMTFNEWVTFFVNWTPRISYSKMTTELNHCWDKLNNKLLNIIQKKDKNQKKCSDASQIDLLSCFASRVNIATELQQTKFFKQTYKEFNNSCNSITESSFKDMLELDYSISYTLIVWERILSKENLSLLFDIPERQKMCLSYLIKAVGKSHEQLYNKDSLSDNFQSFLLLLQHMLFDCRNTSLHKMWRDLYMHDTPIFILEVDFIYIMTTLLFMRKSFLVFENDETSRKNDMLSKFLQKASYHINIIRLIYRYVSFQALLSLKITELDSAESIFDKLQKDNPTLWNDENVNKLYQFRMELSQILSLPVMTKCEVAVAFSRSVISFLRCSTLLLTILGSISPLPLYDNSKIEFNYLMDLLELSICPNDDKLMTTYYNSHIHMINNSTQMRTMRGTKLPHCLPLNPPTLIDLPHDFIDILNLGIERGCSLRNKSDEVVTEITLCLICGDTFCISGYCCRYSEESSTTVLSGAQIHARQCHGGYSPFLNTRTSKIVVLFFQARLQIILEPIYFDSYGEYDIDLKKGNPLFLNIDAYKKLERNWLEHSICNFLQDGDDFFE